MPVHARNDTGGARAGRPAPGGRRRFCANFGKPLTWVRADAPSWARDRLSRTCWTFTTNAAGGVHGPLAHRDHRSVRGRALGRLGSRGCPLAADLHACRGTRRRHAGRPAAGPGRQRGPAGARPGRFRFHLRDRRQPGPLRRRAAREDRRPRPPPGPVRDGAGPRGPGGGAAGPRDLPRHAHPQRGPRRHADPASPGRGGPQRARPGSGPDEPARGAPERQQHGRHAARFP